ncbi:MAG: kelch repeat-containing protein [Bryobacterales bacterium]
MLRFGVLLVCAAALQAQTEGAWASRAPVPLALAEASAATLGDEVYVVCGIVGIGQYSNRLFAYNPSADSWRERAPLPITGGVERCNVAAWDGKLYLAGAIRVGRGFLSAQTFVYDPAADAWTQKERMGAVHAAAGVAALEGKIYVAGGEGEQRAATVFEAFDVATERWQALSDLPQPRTRLTAQSVNGKFYAVGGRLPGAAPQREVFEYDPAAGSWRTRAPMPTARSDAASAVLGGKILVFGGEGAGGEVLAEVEEFDPPPTRGARSPPCPTRATASPEPPSARKRTCLSELRPRTSLPPTMSSSYVRAPASRPRVWSARPRSSRASRRAR